MIPAAFEDFRIYLPKYLSEEQQKQLFDELSSFPANVDKRFYTSRLKDEPFLFQGDGYGAILMADYAQEKFREVKGFLVSNTCDASLENKRLFNPFLSFAPIFSLKKYEEVLIHQHDGEVVAQHIDSIRKQRITPFFFLPSGGIDEEECFVRLDCAFSLPASEDLINELLQKRLFTLSNYGFYMLLFKLSVHLSRVQESVDRNSGPTSAALAGS
ncbi:hypothetical protein WDW86_02115 [Bdellovibrionota bacterium FG-2]